MHMEDKKKELRYKVGGGNEAEREKQWLQAVLHLETRVRRLWGILCPTSGYAVEKFRKMKERFSGELTVRERSV